MNLFSWHWWVDQMTPSKPPKPFAVMRPKDSMEFQLTFTVDFDEHTTFWTREDLNEFINHVAAAKGKAGTIKLRGWENGVG